MPYSLADLDAAGAKLEAEEQRWANYTGNNPDKWATDRCQARDKVTAIEASLKASGPLARSEHELLEQTLDAAFPGARSRQIVEHEGKRYQR